MRLINNLYICWLSLAHIGLSLSLPAHPLVSRQAGYVPAPLPAPRTPPTFNHLYTAYAYILNSVYYGQGPKGNRIALPTVGGNFTGPLIKGTICDTGTDWGLYDPQTGIFTAASQYNMITDDGVPIYVRTSGSQVGGPYGSVHVHVFLETGNKDLYWLNNALIVGIVDLFDFTDVGFTLRLTTFHMAADATNTTFINGTTYPSSNQFAK